MPVRIRLSRYGRIHRPFFRIVACDGRVHREGKAQEVVGLYDPLRKDKNIEVDMAKIEAWVGRGAQISNGLRNLLKFNGYKLPAVKVEAKAEKKKADKPKATAKGTYVAPTRRAVRAHQAKVKAVRKVADAEKVAKAKADKAAAAPAAEGAEQPKA